MSKWLAEYGLEITFVLVVGLILAMVVSDTHLRDAKCAGLYSLAASRADSLEIARDGCAAYLGRKDGVE